MRSTSPLIVLGTTGPEVHEDPIGKRRRPSSVGRGNQRWFVCMYPVLNANAVSSTCNHHADGMTFRGPRLQNPNGKCPSVWPEWWILRPGPVSGQQMRCGSSSNGSHKTRNHTRVLKKDIRIIRHSLIFRTDPAHWQFTEHVKKGEVLEDEPYLAVAPWDTKRAPSGTSPFFT